jgi:phospholipid/cholesterol/gamma-HCH transport system permease protein
MSTGLGRHILSFSHLTAMALYHAFRPPFRIRMVVRQIHFVAVQSLSIIVFCVCATAVVTILEASFHMKMVIQNDSMVPGFAAALILRELGVVVMALLVTSRAGAGMAAEVATMKITEQIEALQMLGLDPIRFLVTPRLIACTIAGALMSVIANVICLGAAMAVSAIKLGFSIDYFISMSRVFVSVQDLVFATIKGAIFGAVIPLFACYFGLKCRPGAEGVGLATTSAVVATSIAIIILDFVLTYFFSHFY